MTGRAEICYTYDSLDAVVVVSEKEKKMQLTKSMVPMGGLGRLGIAFSISCLLVSSAFAANTWWVAKEDPNASDANAGTEAAPFRTIQAALDNPNFVAGDTVNVKRGIYDEGAMVMGNGTLTVTIDGESTDYTSADGALKLTRKTTVANTVMSFAYQPGENDVGCAILSGFERASGSTIIFR